jgi:hypothetical protein
MLGRHLFLRAVASFLFALTSTAPALRAQRVVDLTATDGTKLKATYLSDAYLADGQRDLARQKATKALELLPSDTTDSEQRRNGIRASAEQKLKELADKPL